MIPCLKKISQEQQRQQQKHNFINKWFSVINDNIHWLCLLAAGSHYSTFYVTCVCGMTEHNGYTSLWILLTIICFESCLTVNHSRRQQQEKILKKKRRREDALISFHKLLTLQQNGTLYTHTLSIRAIHFGMISIKQSLSILPLKRIFPKLSWTFSLDADDDYDTRKRHNLSSITHSKVKHNVRNSITSIIKIV